MFNLFKKKYFDFTNLKKIPKNNYEFDKKEYLKNLEISFNEFEKKKFFNKRNLSYPNIAYYLKKEKKKIDFFDIGANNLDNYFHLKKKFQKKIRYFFYDQENKSLIIEDFSKKKSLKNIYVLKKNFKKINNLKKNNLSIFFLGSVIQYLKDHKKFLKKIIYLKPKRIMICGNIFYRNKFPSKKILMKQLNMWPQIYYQFFYNIEDIVEFFKKNSYLLVLKEKNFSDKNLNFSNIKSHFDEIDRYNLIFEKKND